MDVIRHDHESVKIVFDQVPILNRFDHLRGDVGYSQVSRTHAGVGQKAIHGQESPAGRDRRRGRKAAASWQAAMKTPGDEQGPANRMDVWEATSVESGHAG